MKQDVIGAGLHKFELGDLVLIDYSIDKVPAYIIGYDNYPWYVVVEFYQSYETKVPENWLEKISK